MLVCTSIYWYVLIYNGICLYVLACTFMVWLHTLAVCVDALVHRKRGTRHDGSRIDNDTTVAVLTVSSLVHHALHPIAHHVNHLHGIVRDAVHRHSGQLEDDVQCSSYVLFAGQVLGFSGLPGHTTKRRAKLTFGRLLAAS
jgi:hypothetical protein